MTISTGVVIAFAAVALARAGKTRTRVRAMGVATMRGYSDAAATAARDKLLAMAMTLTSADERVDEERMSPLDHEALWWQVYEQLAPARVHKCRCRTACRVQTRALAVKRAR